MEGDLSHFMAKLLTWTSRKQIKLTGLEVLFWMANLILTTFLIWMRRLYSIEQFLTIYRQEASRERK